MRRRRYVLRTAWFALIVALSATWLLAVALPRWGTEQQRAPIVTDDLRNTASLAITTPVIMPWGMHGRVL